MNKFLGEIACYFFNSSIDTGYFSWYIDLVN